SVGQGRWADVPWIGIFDKSITTSAQKGYYVCILFGDNMNSVFLTIINSISSGMQFNQAIPEGQTVIQTMRNKLQHHIKDNPKYVSSGINFEEPVLFGTTQRAKEYTSSTFFYKEYKKDYLPSETQFLN